MTIGLLNYRPLSSDVCCSCHTAVMIIRKVKLLLALAVALSLHLEGPYHQVWAYVNHKSAVPLFRQHEFLTQITSEIVDSPTGALSEEMIAESHHVMKGWGSYASAKSQASSFSPSKKSASSSSSYTSSYRPHVQRHTSATAASSSSSYSVQDAIAMETLLKRLVDESIATGNHNACPTIDDYNSLLQSWAAVASTTPPSSTSRSQSSSSRNKIMITTSAISNKVNDDNEKQEKENDYDEDRFRVFAAERCEQILSELVCRQDERIKPNLSSFKAAIMAWKHTGGQSLSSFRAQRILEWMVTLYDQGGHDRLLPDSDTFNAVLQSWANNPHKLAPSYAESLLGAMEHISRTTNSPTLRPTTTSFNSVLLAWSNLIVQQQNGGKSDDKSWKRACEVLDFQEKLSHVEGRDSVKPDRVTYRIMMNLLSNVSKNRPTVARKADSILKSIERRFKQNELSWEPETILFNTVIGCHAKCNSEASYRKARSVLDRQIFLWKAGCESCRPDAISFTSVISACSSSGISGKEEKAKALNVAIGTYKQLLDNESEFGPCNEVTIAEVLKGISSNSPFRCPKRNRLARNLGNEARSRGLLSDSVYNRLHEAMPKNDFKQFLHGHTKSSLPTSWTRDVGKFSRRRKNPSTSSKQRRKRAEV